MAEAKKVGKDGIDRWTSNGYGLSVGEMTKEQKERIAKLNDELRNMTKGDSIDKIRK